MVIQVIGETKFQFNINKISIDSVKQCLQNNFEKHDIISQRLSNADCLLHVKFIMHMLEKDSCKQFADYSSYIRQELTDKLPAVFTKAITVHNMSCGKKEPITHIKSHIVSYFDNLTSK